MDSSVSPERRNLFSARVPSHFNWPIVPVIDSSRNVMAHGDVRKGKWRGDWRMEWVASTLHTTSEHGISSITTDAHTSAACSRLNWRSRRFKWTRPFRRKDEIWFLRVWHHISTGLYQLQGLKQSKKTGTTVRPGTSANYHQHTLSDNPGARR